MFCFLYIIGPYLSRVKSPPDQLENFSGQFVFLSFQKKQSPKNHFMHCRGVESLPEEFPILFCLRLEDNSEMLYYIIILIPCSEYNKDLINLNVGNFLTLIC